MPSGPTRSKFLRVLRAAAIGVSLFVVSPVAAETPSERIAAFNETLLAVMKNAQSLGYEGRYTRLEPAITALFNLPLMAQIAVGGHWRTLDESQRDRLVDAFSRLSIATFAARFDGYSGETFEVVGAEEALRDAVMVRTNLVQPDGNTIALNYLTRDGTGDWQVIDIFLDARFSELARLRADYTSVLDRQGFDSLIATIEQRIDELSAAGS